jgi:dienelactone hydrolase
MKKVGLLILSLLLFPVVQAQQDLQLQAADGVQVFGTLYEASKDKPIILLFHQADSNRAEYAEIAPELVALGFNALAIDQRSGGRLYGATNQTKENFEGVAGYLESLPDLEAALTWANTEGYKTILVWGSSYSAALVFLLAANHPEVDGILSFSPGEYLGNTHTVQDAAAGVTVPVFITSSKFEAEEAKTILDVVVSKDKVQFISEGFGQHGSAALLSKDKDEYWTAVKAFLTRWLP